LLHGAPSSLSRQETKAPEKAEDARQNSTAGFLFPADRTFNFVPHCLPNFKYVTAWPLYYIYVGMPGIFFSEICSPSPMMPRGLVE
jgi:hypothetical protein